MVMKMTTYENTISDLHTLIDKTNNGSCEGIMCRKIAENAIELINWYDAELKTIEKDTTKEETK